MDYKFLLYHSEGGLVTITLNRPIVYNALNDEITFELQDAFKKVSADDHIRVVILTGAGKAFCSGQDLKDSATRPKRSFKESLRKRYNPIILAIRNLPKPIICRLNGVAAGAGCSLALACDIIIASDEARLIEIFVNIGLVPDSGSSYFLPRIVGIAKSFELFTKGNSINAREGLELGIINRVVPINSLDSTVKEYSDYFATAPTKAIGLIKRMLQRSATSSLEEMLEYEAYCQEIAGGTEDHKEGVKAFMEKRKPSFFGK